MIKADYHVHSQFSSDSDAKMELMIEKAIYLGFERICFTDHMDYDYPKENGMDFLFDIDAYFHKLNNLKGIYQNDIKVLIGIELGLMPYLKSRYDILLKNHAFDFVIGSSHLVKGEDPYFPQFWEGKTEEEGMVAYFQSIIDNLEVFDNFDTYGHIDYIVRYGPNKNKYYTYKKYEAILSKLLKLLIAKGKALEINTAGYKYGLGHAHPQEDVLQQYKELGGTYITIGSDAHKVEHFAYDFEMAGKMLREIGFTKYVVYEGRSPLFLDL